MPIYYYSRNGANVKLVQNRKPFAWAIAVALMAGTVVVPASAWAEEFIQDFPELAARGTWIKIGSCSEAQRSVTLPPGYEIDYSANNQGYLIKVLKMNDPNGSSVKHTLDLNTKTLTSYVRVCPKYNQRAWYTGRHILYGKKSVASSTEIVATPPATICAGSTFDVTIRVNKTDAQAIDGAELALKFDKSKLKVNKITDSGVLDFELDSTHDNATGDINFYAIALDNPVQTASFDVMTINFTAIGNAKTTVLDLLDNSKLTNSGETVLASIVDNTLTFSQCLDYQVNLQQTKPKGSWANTDLAISLGTTTVANSYPSTANASGEGTLTLADVPTNDDYFCVKNSHTLANKIVQTYPKVGNRIDFGTLWEGDAKEDNILNINDASFIASKTECYTACQPNLPATCTATDFQQSDLNVDGCVNVDDVKLFQSNFKTPNLKVSECGLKPTGMYRKGVREGNQQAVSLATVVPNDLVVGTSFDYTVQVNATENQPINAAAVYLNFDPTKLQVNRITTGESFDFTLDDAVDNTKGQINFAALVLDKALPTQTVDLVTINFTALQAGEHTITFSHSPERETVITHAGEDVTGTTENGQIVVKPISTTEETVTCPLYGVQDQGLNDSILFTINSESKQVLPLGETCTGCDIEALDIQPVTNVPYLASGNDARQHPNGHLYKLNTQTGELISVGNTGFKDISSLAFDKQGILWAWAKDAGLVKLDTGTGEGTVVIASSAAFADLTWNTEGTTLYGAIGTELWSYTPATDTVTQVCDNLPEKTEAIRVLPTVILPKGFLLLGAHKDDSLKLHAFDTETCQLVAEADILIPYDDVEGLAMPPAPCTMIK